MISVTLPWPPRVLHPNSRDVFPHIEKLRDAFSCDPATGILIRIKKTGPNVRVGEEAGWLDGQGYRRVMFLGKGWQAHRLVWAHFYGTTPPSLIDHINGDRSDNRIANLRAATRSINTQNLKRSRSDNRLGVLGVRERRGRYESRIMVDGRSTYIGSFATLDEASSAYLAAKRRLHPGGTL